jgi:hypothetical protein
MIGLAINAASCGKGGFIDSVSSTNLTGRDGHRGLLRRLTHVRVRRRHAATCGPGRMQCRNPFATCPAIAALPHARCVRHVSRRHRKALQQARFGESGVTISDYIRCLIIRSPSEINSMFILQFKLILDHRS